MARLPEFITFTGIDTRTDIDDLKDLSADYPVEYGILFSAGRQGFDKRYPDPARMTDLGGFGLTLAAHICGAYSVSIMTGRRNMDAWPKTIFTRAQVNHPRPDINAINQARWPNGPVCIAQTSSDFFPDDDTVQWLFDRSSGRGVQTDFWPRHPGGDRLVGYAGGLNPANVVAAIDRIDAAGPYWIDMESGVRTDNWFDVGLCRKVCEAVYGAPKAPF